MAAGSFGGVGLLTAGPFEVVVLVERFGTGDGMVVGGVVFSARPSSGVEGAALKGEGPDGLGGTPCVEGGDLTGGREPDRITRGIGEVSRRVFLNGGLGGDIAALGSEPRTWPPGQKKRRKGGAHLAYPVSQSRRDSQ